VAVLGEFDVHIWYCITELLDPDAASTANAYLSISEKDRRARFRSETDRRDFAIAHGLLRQALSFCANLAPSDWHFATDARGKPLIDSNNREHKELSFSLSHTNGFVACAVARNLPVGIDVEWIDQSLPSQEIADRYFSDKEARQLRDCSKTQRAVRFVELWTLKEAFLKAVGVGHFGSMTDISFQLDEHCNIAFSAPAVTGFPDWQFALFEPLSNVRMSIAVAGASSPRYFVRQYNGQSLEPLLATPSRQSAAQPI
jgi:phosphopantetheinyl transferase